MSASVDAIRTVEYKYNEFGQKIGLPIDNWTPRVHPRDAEIPQGKYVRLERLDPDAHIDDLCAALSLDNDGSAFTYMIVPEMYPEGVFNRDICYSFLVTRSRDPAYVTYTILDKRTDKAVGWFSLMSIDVNSGAAEMGSVVYTPLLRKTLLATDAQFTVMKFVFETLGYRRYQWKCDSRHVGSSNAAVRLGFTFEGITRNLVVYKGRQRDTFWFSIIPQEYEFIKHAFESYLDESNFKDGIQVVALSKLMTEAKTKYEAHRAQVELEYLNVEYPTINKQQ